MKHIRYKKLRETKEFQPYCIGGQKILKLGTS